MNKRNLYIFSIAVLFICVVVYILTPVFEKVLFGVERGGPVEWNGMIIPIPKNSEYILGDNSIIISIEERAGDSDVYFKMLTSNKNSQDVDININKYLQSRGMSSYNYTYFMIDGERIQKFEIARQNKDDPSGGLFVKDRATLILYNVDEWKQIEKMLFSIKFTENR